MPYQLSRRRMLAAAPMLGLTAALPRAATAQMTTGSPTYDDASHSSHFPFQSRELVQQVVGLSHRDFDGVKERVRAHPELAKATIDWGFGDFETALGAASHTGRREIALLLMEHGARPDIFAFAMLGHVDAVKAMIESQPGVQKIAGPHGLSLLHHARQGGDEAADVVSYLKSLGDADPQYTNIELSEAQKAIYAGNYQTRDDGGSQFTIKAAGNTGMQFEMDGSTRNLFHQGNHEFHPAGAPSVRFRFTVEGDRTTRLTIADGEAIVEAKCVG